MPKPDFVTLPALRAVGSPDRPAPTMITSLTPAEERAIISDLLTAPARINQHLDAWAALGDADDAIYSGNWNEPAYYHLYMALMYGRASGIDWNALKG